MSRPPFVVIGFPRSGTTLLQCMLAGHPHLAVAPETRFVLPTYRNRRAYGDLRDPARRARLIDDIVERDDWHSGDLGLPRETLRAALEAAEPTLGAIHAAAFEAYARSQGALRWGDKHPRYTQQVHMLRRLFPGVQIVHLVRDPRAAVESLLRMPWYTRDAPHAVRAWADAIDRGRVHARRLGASDYHEVRYEDLVTDPETTMKRLAGFLGEEYHPAMATPEVGARRSLPDDRVFHKAVRGALRPRLVDAWRERLSPEDVGLLEWALGARMIAKGYEPSGAPEPTAAVRLAYRQLELAAAVDARRMRLRDDAKSVLHQQPLAAPVRD